ncbi:MAG: tetratricopeptide repeat protein [Chloroflexi bacterium SZAS-1]|nr:tetratricopeptide repeat protein [Chloroflexi bacterium SZAS-1]
MYDDLFAQLAAHRFTLAQQREQRAKFGAGMVPPQIDHTIAEACAAIDQLKAQLRAAGVDVDDAPGDTQSQLSDIAGQYDAAEALLATLPEDEIPAPASLPMPHRMPLVRNPLFVGRDDQLKALARTLKSAQSAAAIGQVAASTGMGGIGKTNLATEFVHRYGVYFAGGVFWLSFADAAGIVAEIAACGASGIVQHPNWNELPVDEQVALVRQAWESPIPRLLIFDNCEDEELVRTWRPTTGGCRILITSRRDRWSNTLGIIAQPLDVLSRAESIRLLHKHRPDLQHTTQALDALAHELGDLPLALHLAGSYLETNAEDPILGDPSALLRELRSRPILEHEALQGIDTTFSPTNHLLHVGRTFSLSYQLLNPKDPINLIARDILACAVCLAPGEPIPRELLIKIVVADPDDTAQRRSGGRAIERARSVGLLESVGGHSFKIHRLVRWFLEQISEREVAQKKVEGTVYDLARFLQANPDASTILACQPHFRWVADAALEQHHEQAAYLCSEVALCLNAIGIYSIAQYYFEQVLAVLQAQGHTNTDELAATLTNIAGVLWDQGDYAQARTYLEQALLLDEQIHGPDAPETANSLNALASILQAQGDYAVARPMYERALAIREQVLGPNHPNTATGLNNLGLLLRDMGALVEARPYLHRALLILEQALGPTHPNTATVLNNVGLLLQDIGALAESRPYLERALSIYEQILGPTHPDTAMSLNNLGLLLRDMGLLAEARPYLERALIIYKQVLEPTHPNTAMSLNNLGLLLRDMDLLAEAQPYLEQALSISQQTLGPTHPTTAVGLNNLGLLLRDMGLLAEARPYLERALSIYQQSLGSMHPSTAMSLNNLGLLLRDMGAVAEAQPYLEQALSIYEQAFGPEHSNTGMCLNNLAGIYYTQGDNVAARLLYERALAICEQVLGVEHPTTTTIRANLAALNAQSPPDGG